MLGHRSETGNCFEWSLQNVGFYGAEHYAGTYLLGDMLQDRRVSPPFSGPLHRAL
jgi:hypothetical protein